MLTVKLGAQVQLAIDGHSATNGAPIPEGSKVEITSNDPSVATIDAVSVPVGGAQEIIATVTILAKGSTDGHVKITTPDGSIFEATDTLVVEEVLPGLLSISATFQVVQPTPTP